MHLFIGKKYLEIKFLYDNILYCDSLISTEKLECFKIGLFIQQFVRWF